MSAEDGVDLELQRLLEELATVPGFERRDEAAPAPVEPQSAAPVAPAAPPAGPVVVRVPAKYRPEGEIEVVAHKRILVVDDNDDHRETLRALLTVRGYEVYGAPDGARGMELALDAEPHLIITDFNMPRMNGYELVARLRASAETAGTPMILFTGAANRRQLQGLHIERCLLLEKPFRNEVLFDAVADFIGNAWPASSGGGAVPHAAGEPAAEAEEPAAITLIRAEPDPPAAIQPTEEPDGGDDDGGLLRVEEAEEEAEPTSLDVEASDSPTVARLNRLLARAVRAGASDVHFECEADRVVVRFRVDGGMRQAAALPYSLRGRIATRLKIMSKLVITERRLPQDGQIRAVVDGRSVDFRVSTMPAQHGENVVLRLMAGTAVRPGLGHLGLSARDLQVVERAVSVSNGLVLVTGPTGSGKTTTLYTMLQMLNTPEAKILTAEDPVEQELRGVTQVGVRPAIGLTFEKALRAFMRQDPDVILIGEIRDLETADIAIKASITGHLVLSTLHTNSAPATIVRLTQMGLPAYLLSSSLRLIVAQRLVRILCAKCKQLSDTPELDLKVLTEAEVKRIKKSWVGKGCDECHKTGYRGRMPLFEVMPVNTTNMRAAILDAAGEDRLMKLATLEGMTTLREAALNVVAAGHTSLAEAMPFIVGE